MREPSLVKEEELLELPCRFCRLFRDSGREGSGERKWGRKRKKLLYADCGLARTVNLLQVESTSGGWLVVGRESVCVSLYARSLDFLVKPRAEWASTNGSGVMALEV